MLKELFNEIDAEHGGLIGVSGIMELARRLGNKLSDSELAAAMKEMDEDDSGMVD